MEGSHFGANHTPSLPAASAQPDTLIPLPPVTHEQEEHKDAAPMAVVVSASSSASPLSSPAVPLAPPAPAGTTVTVSRQATVTQVNRASSAFQPPVAPDEDAVAAIPAMIQSAEAEAAAAAARQKDLVARFEHTTTDMGFTDAFDDIEGRIIRSPAPRSAGDVEAFKAAGVDTVICLLDDGDLDRLKGGGWGRRSKAKQFNLLVQYEANGLDVIRFPIRDFSVPKLSDLEAIVKELIARASSGQTVVVHCMGGIGRTGLLMTAAWITLSGKSFGSTLPIIRKKVRGAVESKSQHALLKQYAKKHSIEAEPPLSAHEIARLKSTLRYTPIKLGDMQIIRTCNPMGYGSSEEGIEFLAEDGVKSVVCLLEKNRIRRLQAAYEKCGIAFASCPIQDFQTPSMDELKQYVQILAKLASTGEKVLVHCQGGTGRTGLVLAAFYIYLMEGEATGNDALKWIRGHIHGAVETGPQRKMLTSYFAELYPEASSSAASAASADATVADELLAGRASTIPDGGVSGPSSGSLHVDVEGFGFGDGIEWDWGDELTPGPGNDDHKESPGVEAGLSPLPAAAQVSARPVLYSEAVGVPSPGEAGPAGPPVPSSSASLSRSASSHEGLDSTGSGPRAPSVPVPAPAARTRPKASSRRRAPQQGVMVDVPLDGPPARVDHRSLAPLPPAVAPDVEQSPGGSGKCCKNKGCSIQ